MTSGSPQTCGVLPENIKKNRYKNIIPYDASRVPLQTVKGKKNSGYINASFVKGFKSYKAFIASQGPNDFILSDFVRMLWEQKVEKVVMLTKLVEEGKKKCSTYWPVEGEEEFGDVTVKLLTTHVFAEYTIRHLRLSTKGQSSRDLTQFHFTAWPDKSVPESPWGLVDLYHRVMAAPGSDPVLVHCSAGVGRTGTFIGLCNLLEEAEATGKMDFKSTLWKLRQDRMHTIQTVEQYKYLHKVALVGYNINGSIINVTDMYFRLVSLESDTEGNKSTRNYQQEFETVVELCAATAPKVKDSPDEEVKNVYQNLGGDTNRIKDRLSNILPNPTYRPDLTAAVPHEDTYINAVLVPNLTNDGHDVLTQLPLPSTVTDFWRLVTQFNVGLIVAFDLDSSQSDETIGDFLPKSETEPFENDRYLVEARQHSEGRLVSEFTLTVHQKIVLCMDDSIPETKKTLALLLCKSLKLDPESILDLQEQIRFRRGTGNARTIYMCRNGADYCGLMCVQSILLDRLKCDRCLAVPVVVGSIKAIRPQVIPTVDQYKCLYRVLKLAHDSQNVYGNLRDVSSSS
ncbi:hypothetical protein RRG08_059848 [Elysia crispata]|uniref:protein-tyrosine-phosphatase n=1 Tax=Elysia crispata TaxID=231223 RepID=A0AAE1CPL8_9GAST|nr:hypothetical protein RRG08_059848 [Elysia crispata]